MNLQEIKYDAFISYRHCELDQFVATTLHKELEAFRLPKAIEKQLRAKGITKKKIERVFRDRDELPITNNLADPITNALRNSDFLLVICSPRLRESLWCRKEIETFIKMHGREHIFAVLIEGEPADSFPEELLYEEKVTVDVNGNEHVEKVPIEPLAADVRGKNKKEIRKKIKEEVLRLAAPMFDCSYDDLKQRHRERAIRRIIATAGSISAVFAVFGIVSSVMAYRINEQSIQIKEQSVQIQKQSDQINEQYQEALRTNAKQMAEDAFDLIERGDIDAAKETAYQALSGEMPYTEEAEYALVSSLQLYRNGQQIAPKRLLKQESQISFCKTSPDMTKLMIVDIFGEMKIYNPLSGEELYGVSLEDTYMTEEQVCFIDNESIVYPVEAGFAVYNFSTKEECTVESDYFSTLASDKNGKYILTVGFDIVTIYDANTLDVLFTGNGEEDINLLYNAYFSRENGKYALVEYTQDDKAGAYIIDLETKTATVFLSDSDSITSMWIEDEYIYLTGYTYADDTAGTVYCIRPDGSLVWECNVSGMPDDIMAFGEQSDDKLAFTVFSKIIVINKADGSYICETDCGRDIVNYASYTDSNTLTYMTRGGEYHYYMTDTNSDMVVADKFVTNSVNLKEFVYGKGYYASVTYNDSSVAIYETITGPDLSLLADIVESPLDIKLSVDEKYLVSSVADSDYQLVVVVDLEAKEIVQKIATGSSILDIAVTADNELMVLHRGSVQGFDLISGEQIFERETETSNKFFLKNGEVYVGDDFLDFFMCDTKTGNVIYTMEGNHLLQDGMLASDIDENAEWYAYASEEEKVLVVGNFEEGDIRSLDVNISAVDAIMLAMEEEAVYLTYLDKSIEVYDINSGELLRTYDNLESSVTEVIVLPSINKKLLVSSGKAWIINENKEVIAKIEGFECYKSSTDSFIVSRYGNLYEVPRYELADLLNKMQ